MSRLEQEDRLFMQLITLLGFFFSFLMTLLGINYQSSSVSLFHEHRAIMLLLIIVVFIGTTASAAVILPTSYTSYIPLFKFVCLISGAFSCDLLLLILVPAFGWFIFTICVFCLLCIFYVLYPQLLNYCRAILQSIRQAPSPESNGSPVQTPETATQLEGIEVSQ